MSLALCSTWAAAQRLPEAVIPEHYQILLNPNIAKASYSGSEMIDVRVRKPTAAITLNAAEIQFKSVTITAGGNTQPAKVSLDAKNGMATLAVEKPIPPGPAKIEIQFSGILNDDLRGFYLTKGKARNYATTQMEPTDARRAFPCFDEPALKATFDISVVADKGDMAISNGKVVSDVAGPSEDKHTVRFSTTPKMSTYLVALVVGDFACVEGASDGIPIRICATPEKKNLLGTALESAEFILKYYNQYYGIKYPYGKLDAIAVPDFSAGAMENTAAITYRETFLLLDPKTASPQDQKFIADVLAHEMAHQWFGDLVTMRWWNDLWLNEGFATWMSPKPVNAWHPEWHNHMDEVGGPYGQNAAMTTDGLKSTPQIRNKVETAAEIAEQFSPSIAYSKTAAILRMVENYVGPQTFRAGVNEYLKQHAYSNATAEDFWNTQTRVSHKPIDKIMAGFVETPGVPLVTVASQCKGDKTEVTLEQQRFFNDRLTMNQGSDQTWEIPVCLKIAGGSRCELLTQKQTTVELKGCSPYVFANAGAEGYYRTAYSAENYRALASNIGKDLSPEERLQTVNDQWFLMRAGKGDIAGYLRLVEGLKNDRDRNMWETLSSRLSFIHDDLVDDSERPRFEAWVQQLLAPAAKELGWKAASGESADLRAVRGDIMRTLAYSGRDPEVISKAKELAQEVMKDQSSVDPDLVQMAITTAAENGDAALYDQYLDHMKQAKSPDQYYLYSGGLTSFRQPELVKRSLEMALTPEVRPQDATFFLGAILSDRYTQKQAWEFLKLHWKELEPKMLAAYTPGEVVGFTGTFCDAASRDDAKEFFANKNLPAVQHSLQQAQERSNSCIDFKAQQENVLRAWIEQSSSAGRPATIQ